MKMARDEVRYEEANRVYKMHFRLETDLKRSQYQYQIGVARNTDTKEYIEDLGKLPSFCEELRRLNPGTIAECVLTEAHQLKYFSVFPSICIDAYMYVVKFSNMHVLCK